MKKQNTFLKLNVKKLGEPKVITFEDGTKGTANSYEKTTIRVPMYYVASFLKQEIEFDNEVSKEDKKLIKEWVENITKKYLYFENYTYNEGINRILFQSLMIDDKQWQGHPQKLHGGLKYWS